MSGCLSMGITIVRMATTVVTTIAFIQTAESFTTQKTIHGVIIATISKAVEVPNTKKTITRQSMAVITTQITVQKAKDS